MPGKRQTSVLDIYVSMADDLFEQGRYYAAADLYGQVIIDRESATLTYKLAEANRLGRFYRFAALWYEDLIEKYPEEYPLAPYWYGLIQKANGGRYDEAIEIFEKFKSTYDGPDAVYYKKRAAAEIKACRLAKQLQERQHQITFYNLGMSINSSASDFGAVEVNDSLFYYTSADEVPLTETKKFLFIKLKETHDTMLLTRLYQAIYKDGTWTDPKLVHIPLQDPKQDIGSPAFSADGKTMYFSMCKGTYGNKNCHIYFTEQEDTGWGEPVKLGKPVNDKEDLFQKMFGGEVYSSKHPVVYEASRRRHWLIFSSDREGGEGGFDIWFCPIYANGRLGHVRNAGPVINTTEDEITPFYRPEVNKLFFSSNGHPGLGAYDIFHITGSPGRRWEKEVHNIGPPVNSETDDYYFTQYHSTKRTYGYVASNRPGGLTERGTCCDDIYFYALAPDYYTAKGWVLEQQTGKNLKAHRVELLEVAGKDTTVKTQVNNVHEFNFYLSSDTTYFARIYKNNHYPAFAQLSPERVRDTILVPVSLEPVHLPRIPFNTHEPILNDKAQSELNFLHAVLEANPEMIVVINAHSDDRPSSEASIAISQKYSKAVHDFLVDHGISEQRIITRWFGDIQPVADNNIEAGRAANRRAEIEIIYDRREKASGLVATAKAMDTVTPAGGVMFKVQLAALEKTSNEEPNFSHLTLPYKIEVEIDGQFRKYLVAREFTDLNEAVRMKNNMIQQGINDAWVVFYAGGQRTFDWEKLQEIRKMQSVQEAENEVTYDKHSPDN